MAQSEPTALFAAEMRKAMEGMAQTRELIHSFVDEHGQVIVQLGEDSQRTVIALDTLAQTVAQLRAEVRELRGAVLPACTEGLRQAGKVQPRMCPRCGPGPRQDESYATAWPRSTPKNWEAKP